MCEYDAHTYAYFYINVHAGARRETLYTPERGVVSGGKIYIYICVCVCVCVCDVNKASIIILIIIMVIDL